MLHSLDSSDTILLARFLAADIVVAFLAADSRVLKNTSETFSGHRQ